MIVRIVAISFGLFGFIISGVAADPFRALTNWTIRLDAYQDLDGSVEDIAYGAGRYVAVCSSNAMPGSVFLTSSNAADWSVVWSSSADYWTITYGNGYFVAAGPNKCVSSGDGTRWIENPDPSFGYLQDLTFSQGLFIAAGFTNLLGSEAIFWSSIDGSNWVERLRFPRFGATGYGRIQLAANSNVVVAAGTFEDHEDYATPIFLNSTNGINWRFLPLPVRPFHALHALTYGGGMFVVAGSWYSNFLRRDFVLVSSNGFDWVERPAVWPKGYDTWRLAYENGIFLSIGEDDSYFYYSTNAIDWRQVNPPTSVEVDGRILYVNGRFMLSGSTLLQSGSFAAAQLEINFKSRGPASIVLTGEIGRSYILQSSAVSSGASWEDEPSVTLAGYSTNISINVPPSVPARFYRAVSP